MKFVTYKVTNEVVYFKGDANYCILYKGMCLFYSNVIKLNTFDKKIGELSFPRLYMINR